MLTPQPYLVPSLESSQLVWGGEGSADARLEIAHDEMLEGDCPGDDNDICIISCSCLCLFALLARMSSPSSTSLPTTRSRTLLFISYRDSRARSTRFSRPQSSYDEPDQPADENEHLITRHLTLDLHLPPKW